jgi:hypothetical protein
MFLGTEMHRTRTPSGVPCGGYAKHFTPDGVSRPNALVTINMALLTEGRKLRGCGDGLCFVSKCIRSLRKGENHATHPWRL